MIQFKLSYFLLGSESMAGLEERQLTLKGQTKQPWPTGIRMRSD